MNAGQQFILEMALIDANRQIQTLKVQHLTELRRLRDSVMGPIQRFTLDNGTLGTEAQLIAEIPF